MRLQLTGRPGLQTREEPEGPFSGCLMGVLAAATAPCHVNIFVGLLQKYRIKDKEGGGESTPDGNSSLYITYYWKRHPVTSTLIYSIDVIQ